MPTKAKAPEKSPLDAALATKRAATRVLHHARRRRIELATGELALDREAIKAAYAQWKVAQDRFLKLFYAARTAAHEEKLSALKRQILQDEKDMAT